jgi:putative cardiolipin synthase
MNPPSIPRARLVAGILLLALLPGCASLPSLEGRVASTAITDTAQTRLGRRFLPELQARAPASAVYALSNPALAFAARQALARWAEKSLDVQYYIWHGDTTGYLMFAELYAAAERGVRVRILLDDASTGGMDETIAAMDAHPNIEVRLFNPTRYRTQRWWGYLTDFSRLNRRMHNKSFTADSLVTVIGGRNIGDEYFGAGDDKVFADLDILGAGPIAGEAAGEFDAYWNSASAYPAGLILGRLSAGASERLQAKFASVRDSAGARNYLATFEQSPLSSLLERQNLPLQWAKTHVIFDDPKKALGQAVDSDLLLTKLVEFNGRTEHQLDLISPYFVPGKEGTKRLAELAGRGVQVRILTNSLSATDVGVVHAGYAKRREKMLQVGVELYEMKPDAERPGPAEKKKHEPGMGISSGVSLHAKTFAADRERVFIGSFNLDPRSAHLNTEMGAVIESPEMAEAVSVGFESKAAHNAYQVRLAPQGGGLQWVELTATGEVIHRTEPHTSLWRRFSVGLMSLLPIEWLL